jgi:hypothetical protein
MKKKLVNVAIAACAGAIVFALLSLFFVLPVCADYLTCDPQPKDMVTKYQIDLNGEILSASVEAVNADQVRIHYNIDHLSDGKYIVTAQAGNDEGEWSSWSEELKFYCGVPTPQNIGLYCASEELKRIPQDTLSLYYFSSEEIVKANKPALNVLDGSKDTIWVSDWSKVHPHEIQIDFGRVCQVSGMYVLPRQDSGTWGAIKNYEIYVSTDEIDWVKVKSGVFLFNKNEQLAEFGITVAKYISLVCLSEHSGSRKASIAEINILGY